MFSMRESMSHLIASLNEKHVRAKGSIFCTTGDQSASTLNSYLLGTNPWKVIPVGESVTYRSVREQQASTFSALLCRSSTRSHRSLRSTLDEILARLSSMDLHELVGSIKKELTPASSGSPTNQNGIRAKGNLLNYIGCTCLEQTNAGAFADALMAQDVHKDLVNIISSAGSMES